ncbi:hypothetical protein Tco_1420536 [Tanacetum coccineum]
MEDLNTGASLLRGCLKASMIRSIDGKILGKDGKPMKAYRQVKFGTEAEAFVEPVAKEDNVLPDRGWEDNEIHAMQDGNGDSNAQIVNKSSLLFAVVVQDRPAKRMVKIKELRNDEKVEGAAVAIPLSVVEEVSARFSNTLYGYFIGKRLAFRLVENYVQNTWAKFGIKRVMLDEGFFLFQFETKEGMEKVMESGLWLIRLVPLILNVWTPNTILKKDKIKAAPVWVKLHHVPIVAYSETGLSLITTQIGKPIMLDSYTSQMCLWSWGKNEYARALIEVSSDEDLMESIVIAIPYSDGKGHALATIDVEYEWRPPHCSTCKNFDHTNETCPKLPKVDTKVNDTKGSGTNDGFVEGETSKLQQNGDGNGTNNSMNTSTKVSSSKINDTSTLVKLANSFSALHDEENDIDKGKGQALLLVILSMFNIASWNIRGLNFSPKQNEVKHVVFENKLSVFAILESHVSDSKLVKLCTYVFRHWHWTSNGAYCSKGSRIIVGWNQDEADLTVIAQDDQVIHTRIWMKTEKKELFCSFIYAHNCYSHRRVLWKNLGLHKLYVRQRPWCLLGDFNAALFLDDMVAGPASLDIAMREFNDCVEDIEGAHVIFQPYRISDHAPAVLSIPTAVKVKPKQFKFFNILVHNVRFKEVVLDGWNVNVSGFHMFKVVQRLKNLKKPLHKMLYDHGNIHENVKRLRVELDKVQRQERFLKQKAKIEWLRAGDTNSAYFHKSVKSRASRSRNDVITNSEGVLFENDKVANVFLSHYEVFLGQAGNASVFNTSNLFGNKLDETAAHDMVRNISNKEEAWDIVGNDVTCAVCEFFMNGKLLNELNHTIIARIPKVSSPLRVTDFRPISCCNVLFKTITKIISNRLKESLKVLVSPNQSTFVPEAFKVDIQKAYDTVDWGFLKEVLIGFGFHARMVHWIMECVTTTSFSISINGNLHGYFKGKRGLRQGDSLSPKVSIV